MGVSALTGCCRWRQLVDNGSGHCLPCHCYLYVWHWTPFMKRKITVASLGGWKHQHFCYMKPLLGKSLSMNLNFIFIRLEFKITILKRFMVTAHLRRPKKNHFFSFIWLNWVHIFALSFQKEKKFKSQSTSFDTKTWKIASNCKFESCLSIRCLASQHIFRFCHLCRSIFLCLKLFCPFFVSSSSTLHWAMEIKTTCLQWVTFPGKSWSIVIDDR